MTNLQLLQVRQSECREQINRLLSIDINARSTENDDELNTLTTEAMKLEPAIRAAILASPIRRKPSSRPLTPNNANGWR